MNIVRKLPAQLGLILLLPLLAIAWSLPADAVPITTFNSAFQFRYRIGPNSIGLPEGDQHVVGILGVSPTAGTSVSATQGGVTRPLSFDPHTVFPTEFDSFAPFDPSLTGRWSITATNGPDVAGPLLTNVIANPLLLPFVENVQIIGSGATPTLTWTLPDLGGATADDIRIWVHNDATNDNFFNLTLPGNTTQFTLPNGLLAPGLPYVFTVNLEYLGNRSGVFTQVPYVIPEPGTGILIGVGMGVLATRRRRGLARG